MVDARAHRFCFKSVTVHRDKVLGVGAYGSVYLAQCDELQCAAKELHGELILPFQQARQVAASRAHKLPAHRFQQECDFLREIRHPNIILFLGMWQDPVTNLPVLLMELMDGNLTAFLENPKNSISFRMQVGFCHDIAQALSYLHSNEIIHRDLSSNNILLIGDRLAKVTDLGMAVFEDARRKRTEVPGTAAYMPPEVKGDNPEPTAKTDVFSFGVLTVQIIVREFPKPSEMPLSRGAFGNLRDSLLGCDSEIERRQNHISLINKDHPLKPLALNCLKDSQKKRPSSSELCQLLRSLQDVDYKVADLSSNQPLDEAVEYQKITLKPERNHESLHMSLALPKRVRQDFTHSERYSKRTLAGIMDDIGSVDMEGFEEIKVDELQTLPFRTDPQVSDISGTVSIKWTKKGQKMPQPMSRTTSCVTHDNQIYALLGQNGSKLFSFQPLHVKWVEHAPPPVHQGSLAVVNNHLVLVGGKYSDKLYSLVEDEWSTKLPSMSTKRYSSTTASTTAFLIVVGGVGKGGKRVRTIEVLDIDERRWSTVANFPEVCSSLSASFCGRRLYVFGYLNTVYSCEVDTLVNSIALFGARKPQDVWESVTNLPVASSTCVALNNSLYAVGGKLPNGDPTDAVYQYNPVKERWSVYTHMHTARSQCFAAFCRNKLVVMGGVNVQALDTVETASWKYV